LFILLPKISELNNPQKEKKNKFLFPELNAKSDQFSHFIIQWLKNSKICVIKKKVGSTSQEREDDLVRFANSLAGV
jgi:hypothetical protein